MTPNEKTMLDTLTRCQSNCTKLRERALHAERSVGVLRSEMATSERWRGILKDQLRLQERTITDLRLELNRATERAEQTRRIDAERIAELEREKRRLQSEVDDARAQRDKMLPVVEAAETWASASLEVRGSWYSRTSRALWDAVQALNNAPQPKPTPPTPKVGGLWWCTDDEGENAEVVFIHDVTDRKLYPIDIITSNPGMGAARRSNLIRRIVPKVGQVWTDGAHRYTVSRVCNNEPFGDDFVTMADDHGQCCDYTLRQLAEQGWLPEETADLHCDQQAVGSPEREVV